MVISKKISNFANYLHIETSNRHSYQKKMKKTVKNILKLLVIIAMLSSCTMAKEIPYFKNLESTNGELPITQSEAYIHNNDILGITISAMDPMAVAPFNLPRICSLMIRWI